MEGKERCNQFVYNLVPMHIKNFVSIRRCAQLSLRTQFTASQKNRVIANIGANCSQRSKQRNADDGKQGGRGRDPLSHLLSPILSPHSIFLFSIVLFYKYNNTSHCTYKTTLSIHQSLLLSTLDISSIPNNATQ